MRWRAVILVWLAVAAAGCIHLATHEEKEESFQPFATRRLDGQALRDYIEDRTAIVVAGAKPGGVKVVSGEIGVALKPTGADGKVDVSSAAAISRDGYYLTAAHGLRRRPVFLVISTSAGTQACTARVVWQPPATDDDGPEDTGGFDLAVLKVATTLPGSFILAEDSDVTAGLLVVTTGANGEAGGRVLSVRHFDPPAGSTLPHAMTLVHDLPLAYGDSGGPLTTLDGRLIGIQVLVRGVYLGPRQGVALRPDPRWLKQIIQDDRERN